MALQVHNPGWSESSRHAPYALELPVARVPLADDPTGWHPLCQGLLICMGPSGCELDVLTVRGEPRSLAGRGSFYANTAARADQHTNGYAHAVGRGVTSTRARRFTDNGADA